MNQRLLELAMRRGALTTRIEAQRQTLAVHAHPLEGAFGVADKALLGVDWLKQHPAAVAAAVAALAILKPRGAWRWAKRGVFVWRGWQSVRNLLAGER